MEIHPSSISELAGSDLCLSEDKGLSLSEGKCFKSSIQAAEPGKFKVPMVSPECLSSARDSMNAAIDLSLQAESAPSPLPDLALQTRKRKVSFSEGTKEHSCNETEGKYILEHHKRKRWSLSFLKNGDVSFLGYFGSCEDGAGAIKNHRQHQGHRGTC